MNAIKIAILGYGTVGSGVLKVLEQNRSHIERKAGQKITAKLVLDKRDFPDDPVVAPLLTHDFEEILQDAEIQIIAEVMGGINPAYDFVKRALLAGKHVCTSNKELVIAHGAELLRLAGERNLNFLFEASVGGGIPVVRPINTALTTDEIVAVAGILNGTSNYMMTQMQNFGKSYDEALREAQVLGYAEADPSADTGGHDAARKIAILLSIVTGKQVDFEGVATKGITELLPIDFDFAREMGFSIKPLVDGRVYKNIVEASSAPFLVHHSDPVSAVFGVFNCVKVQASATGEIMFYGPGAGQLPTAGAVISDIVDIAKHLHRHIMHSWEEEKIPVASAAGYLRRRMVRVSAKNGGIKTDDIKTFVGKMTNEPVITLPKYPGQLAWLTPRETEEMTIRKLEALQNTPSFGKVERILQVYEPVKTDD